MTRRVAWRRTRERPIPRAAAAPWRQLGDLQLGDRGELVQRLHAVNLGARLVTEAVRLCAAITPVTVVEGDR
jgi:hypothetical protein